MRVRVILAILACSARASLSVDMAMERRGREPLFAVIQRAIKLAVSAL